MKILNAELDYTDNFTYNELVMLLVKKGCTLPIISWIKAGDKYNTRRLNLLCLIKV